MRLAHMVGTVWGYDHNWLAMAYRSDRETRPGSVLIFVAEAFGQVVWGASGLGRRNRVLHPLGWGDPPGMAPPGDLSVPGRRQGPAGPRAGCRYLEVDASPDSRPVLERLGLIAVTTSTPYFWDPPAARPPQQPA
jgi:hypothetical protein